jgi:hypothetical protein
VSSSALVFVASAACNAVLGIDEATLCSEGSCDGGAPALSEQIAPNLPGSARDGGADASAGNALSPGSSNEAIPPVRGVNSSAPGGSGPGGSGPASGGTDNAEPATPPDPAGSGGSGGNGSSGSGSNGSGNGNAGSDAVPPPSSPCAGRENGFAFCDGAVRISCGPDGSVAGSTPCPTPQHCSQSTGPTCAACLTGEARCSGAILSVCNAAHTGFNATACAGPSQCNPARASCDAPACAANQLRCDGSVLQVCNPTLTAFDTVIDCGSPAACNAQTGACNICTPGARRCIDSGTAGICDSSGQTETRIECTPLIESCTGGECELLGL